MQTPSYTASVPSATTPGTTYTISVYPDGALDCSCPDSTYRRRTCKHQRQYVARAIPAVPVGTRAA